MGRLVRRRHVADSAPAETAGAEAPQPFNFTRDVVEALAVDGRRKALRFVDAEGVIDKRTFDEIGAAAGRWTALLRSRGLVPGDQVLVFLGPTPAWPAVLLGALKGGFVTVLCPETTSTADLERILGQSGARLLVVDQGGAARVTGLDTAVEVLVCEDVALELRRLDAVQPTHGTTVSDLAVILRDGASATPLSHEVTLEALRQAENGIEVRPDDVVWCVAETGSATCLWDGLLVPWAAGAEIVMHGGGFEPQQRSDLIQRLGVSVLCQAPDDYRRMVQDPARNGELDGLRRAVSLGELDPAVAEAFRAMSGLTVEADSGDTLLTELAVAPARPTPAPDGLVDVPHDRVSDLTTANWHAGPSGERGPVKVVDPTPSTSAAAMAAGLAEAAAADADARRVEEESRVEDERRETEERPAAEEERRAAEARAKADERERKEQEKAAAAQAQADERERKQHEKAAAAAAQRASEEERRAAEAKAKADQRERKEREKEAAAQARRDEAERRTAERQAEADRRAAAELEQRRLAEQARAEAQQERETRPEPIGVANGSQERDGDASPNTALMERLRAYTHHADDVPGDPPPQ